MPKSLLDLPTELHLEILNQSVLKPATLFSRLRLVNRDFQTCVETLFRREILPTSEIRLCATVSEAEIGDPVDVFISVFPFDSVAGALVKYKRTTPNSYTTEEKEQARSTWRNQVCKDRAANHSVSLSATIASGYIVKLPAEAWIEVVVGFERDANEQDFMVLDWKKFVAAYFKAVRPFEEISEEMCNTGTSKRPMFPMY